MNFKCKTNSTNTEANGTFNGTRWLLQFSSSNSEQISFSFSLVWPNHLTRLSILSPKRVAIHICSPEIYIMKLWGPLSDSAWSHGTIQPTWTRSTEVLAAGCQMSAARWNRGANLLSRRFRFGTRTWNWELESSRLVTGNLKPIPSLHFREKFHQSICYTYTHSKINAPKFHLKRYLDSVSM